jgi:hypothetical protein
MFIAAKYTIYGWTPPDLSSAERIWLGEEIAKVGRNAFASSLKLMLSGSPQGTPKQPFSLVDVLSDAESSKKRNHGQSKSPTMQSVASGIPPFFGRL